MSNNRILVVEDEQDIRELIHFHLYKNKYEVCEVADGAQALQMARNFKPALIVLDIMIPEFDGVEVCKRLKADPETEHIKIIFLSAKGEEEDIVKGLEIGADDYVTKPFSPKVLMARVRTVLKRVNNEVNDILKCHGISLDNDRRKVLIDSEEVTLTETEYQILKSFMASPGLVLTRGQIVNSIRGLNHAITDRSVDTQLVSLRKKMGNKGKLIETVWGVGYRFKEV